MRKVFLILSIVLFSFTIAEAQTRILQQSDLVYHGSFKIPDMQDVNNGQYCHYTQGVIAYNPTNNSLFLVCHDWTQTVAEISIPAIGGTATQLQQPRDALEGRLNQINPSDPNSKKIGGMLVSGTKLILSAYSYYDGGGTQVLSHFVRSTNLSTTGTLIGPYRVGTLGAGFYSGYMSNIPTSWQASFGGNIFGGQCCLPIISRSSYGPSASIISLSSLLAGTNPTTATMVVGYTDSHQTLGRWDQNWNFPNNLYNGTTGVRGFIIPENTASAIVIGGQGLGQAGYVPGGAFTAPPYQSQVWAYRISDLIDVKNAVKLPWDIKPYAVWNLSPSIGRDVAGVAVDQATGKIYIAENFADGTKPVIHVMSITGSTPPLPTPIDAVLSAYSLTSFTNWSTCVNLEQTRTETWTRTIVTPASNGGTTGPLSETRIGTQACAIPNPPSIPSFSLTTIITTCRFPISIITPPVGYTNVQFQRSLDGISWTSHGAKDSSSPYTGSAVLSYLEWQFRSLWNGTGQTQLIIPVTVAGPCYIP